MYFKKLNALLIALLVLFTSATPTPAHAENVQSIFGLTGKYGTNSGKSLGNLVITHPSFVMCTGAIGSTTACSYSVSGRVESNSALPLLIEVLTGNGSQVGSFTISSSNALITVNVAAATNMPVYYAVSAASTYASGSRDYIQATNLQVTGTPPAFSLSQEYGPLMDQSSNRTFSANSKLIFVQVGVPIRMHTNLTCLSVPVLAGPVDYKNGQPASVSLISDIDLDLYVIGPNNSASAVKTLSSQKGTWNTTGTTTVTEFQVCGIDPSIGHENYLELRGKATLRLQGATYTASSIDQIVVTGTAPLRQIACSRGSSAIIVKSAIPKCPSGYSNSNIPIINGKLKTTTITCIKGLTIRKVTAVIPNCPSGYRRK